MRGPHARQYFIICQSQCQISVNKLISIKKKSLQKALITSHLVKQQARVIQTNAGKNTCTNTFTENYFYKRILFFSFFPFLLFLPVFVTLYSIFHHFFSKAMQYYCIAVSAGPWAIAHFAQRGNRRGLLLILVCT